MASNKIIGTILSVKLANNLTVDIPAKVDTGADSSSIWASSIKERDGLLSFVLFDSGSIYYNGEICKTSEYKVTRIKNSFGDTEYRYKVKLSIEIDNKKYRAFFNLADRSRNRFPVLIGRRFLHNRFIVDVSKSNSDKNIANFINDKPVAVLTSRIDAKTKDFFEIVSNNLSSDIILEKYRKINYEITDNGEPKITLSNGQDIASARLVYFKAYSLYPEHAIATVEYLKYKHVQFIDKELGNSVCRSKFSEIFRLATNGILVPQTKIVTRPSLMPDYQQLSVNFGDKFVLKDVASDRGKNNFLVTDSISFEKAKARLDGVETIMIQRFIENDGFLRILIMGNKAVQVVQRSSSGHKDPLKSHLNKPFGGNNATELDIKECSSEVISIARKAALVMHRGVAGIDLIKDKNTNKWYVLEVNYNPELLGGKNVIKKAKSLAKLFESKN